VKAIRISRLLVPVLLLPGCFQEEAPRHDASAAVTVKSAARQPAVPRNTDQQVTEGVASVAQLEAMLQEAADPALRREAIYLIADAGEAQDAALIGQALYDADSQVRRAAVEALTGIGGESSADWMLVALGDPDPGIRRAATEALGAIGGDTAKLLLQQSLLDADEGVREAARQMLAEPGFVDAELR
jgi:HEAT repeat protein